MLARAATSVPWPRTRSRRPENSHTTEIGTQTIESTTRPRCMKNPTCERKRAHESTRQVELVDETWDDRQGSNSRRRSRKQQRLTFTHVHTHTQAVPHLLVLLCAVGLGAKGVERGAKAKDDRHTGDVAECGRQRGCRLIPTRQEQ